MFTQGKAFTCESRVTDDGQQCLYSRKGMSMTTGKAGLCSSPNQNTGFRLMHRRSVFCPSCHRRKTCAASSIENRSKGLGGLFAHHCIGEKRVRQGENTNLEANRLWYARHDSGGKQAPRSANKTQKHRRGKQSQERINLSLFMCGVCVHHEPA